MRSLQPVKNYMLSSTNTCRDFFLLSIKKTFDVQNIIHHQCTSPVVCDKWLLEPLMWYYYCKSKQIYLKITDKW